MAAQGRSALVADRPITAAHVIEVDGHEEVD